MEGNNITFGQIPNIQIIGRGINSHLRAGGSGRTSDMLRMLSSLIQNDNILRDAVHELIDESVNTNINRSVSETFLNNLNEINVTDEIIQSGTECSICLESFKIGEKCIQLPCKKKSHYFHCGKGECSGIRPWLSRNNTCPLCRTEFPTDNHPTRHMEPSPENPDMHREIDNPSETNSILPPSLIGTNNTTLTPGQTSGLNYSNIDNIIPDTSDNNIINMEEQIINTVDNYFRRISGDFIQRSLIINSEDLDLQRAIELSLR